MLPATYFYLKKTQNKDNSVANLITNVQPKLAIVFRYALLRLDHYFVSPGKLPEAIKD